MATLKHWLHAVTGSRMHRDTTTDVHRHEESIEFWAATMTSPSHPGHLELPANLIHTKPLRTVGVNDVQQGRGRGDVILNPNCEQMITAISSIVIARPDQPLPPEYNSALLRVLESYGELVRRRKEELHNNEIEALAMENTLREWQKERKAFRAEIKRLEERIVRFQGVEAMRRAREESTLQNESYEVSDQALALIRRYRRQRKQSGTGSKLLHQPSITGNRVHLSPPSGNNNEDLRVGHPPATHDDTALSAIISPVPDAPGYETGAKEPSVLPTPRPVVLPSGIDKLEDSLFPRTQSSLEASSATTVINLQLRPEHTRTTGDGACFPRSNRLRLEETADAGDVPPKLRGSQHERNSRRNPPFCSGDGSEFWMEGPTTPAEQDIQSRTGILIKSAACSAEQSLLSVSPIPGCGQTQGCSEGRDRLNYLVVPDGKTEIVGPLAHMSVPEVSAVESLKKVQAAVRTRQEETGSTRTLNTIGATVFARRVLQSIPAENNDSQKAPTMVSAHTLSKDSHEGEDMGDDHVGSRMCASNRTAAGL